MSDSSLADVVTFDALNPSALNVVARNAVWVQVIEEWPQRRRRPRKQIDSITANNLTLQHSPAGSNHIVVLNATSAINLTVPTPTKDMDRDRLTIIGNGKAAHTVVFTGGFVARFDLMARA